MWPALQQIFCFLCHGRTSARLCCLTLLTACEDAKIDRRTSCIAGHRARPCSSEQDASVATGKERMCLQMRHGANLGLLFLACVLALCLSCMPRGQGPWHDLVEPCWGFGETCCTLLILWRAEASFEAILCERICWAHWAHEQTKQLWFGFYSADPQAWQRPKGMTCPRERKSTTSPKASRFWRT